MKRLIMVTACCLGTLVAVPQAGLAQAPADLGAAGSFMPARPQRLGGNTSMGAHGTGDVVLTAGQDDDTVSATVLAVTIHAPARSGSLVLYPGERNRSSADPVLPFAAHETVTRTVVVPKTWRLRLYNSSAGALRITADVQGFVRDGSPQSAGAIGTTPRVVVADTARGVGVSRHPLAPSKPRAFAVRGVGRLAGLDIGAAVVEFTVSGAESSGALTTHAGRSGSDSAGTFWFAGRRTTVGLAMVPVGVDGRISVENHSAHQVRMRAVVVGYLVSGTAARPGMARALGGHTVLRTSQGIGAARRPVAAGHYVDVPVTGHAGVPASAGFVALSLIASHATGTGFVTAADPAATPVAVRSLSFDRSATRSNLVLAPVGADGRVRLFVHGTGRVDLAAVAEGYVRRPTLITGRLTGPTGRGLQTYVYIRDAHSGYVGVVVSDLSGRYSFSPGDAGRYSVCASSIDRDWYPKNQYPTGLAPVCFGTTDLRGDVAALTVEPGVTTRADLRLRAGAVISGRVTTVSGRPTGHVQLSLTGDTYGLASSMADDGRYTISGLPPDSYSLCFDPFVAPGEHGVVYATACYHAPAGDYDTRTIALDRGQTKSHADVQLFEGGTVRGRLTHEAAGVSIRHDEVQVFRDGKLVGRNYPEESGDYVVPNLPAGDVQVCVDPSFTYDVGQCHPVTVVAHRTATADFDLVTGARARGSVLDDAGAAVAGATVTRTAVTDGATATATTSATGAWTFAPFVAGSYTLCASAPGHPTRCVGPAGGPATPIDFAAGRLHEVTLTLDD